MTRALLLAVALSISANFIVVGFSLVCAAEPTQRAMRLGFVDPISTDYPAFWERLRELGWVQGQNLIIEARSAEGRLDGFPR